MSNTSVHITLFNKVGICNETDSHVHLKLQPTKMLLCLAAHAAVSNQWQLDRLNIARCVFDDFYNEDLEARRDSLGVAATALRNALTRGRENPLLYDRHSQNYILDRQHVAVDACEFRLAYEEAFAAQQLNERIDHLLTAVAKSEGALHDLGITCKRFLAEYNRLKSWQCDARYQLAVCYEAQRNTQDALKYARKALEVDPNASHVRELEERLEKGQTAPAFKPNCLNSLPQYSSSFVSRDTAVTEITSLLHQARLVTVTGPGGCGKTRTILEVASQLLATLPRGISDMFPDGICLVALAPLTDFGSIIQEISKALGVHTGAEITAFSLAQELSPRTMLLVLDNCEHVMEVCREVASSILQQCPGVRILASSRERLEIDAERLYSMPPMSTPSATSRIAGDNLQEYEATRLFLERIPGHLNLDGSDASFVADICRTLEGIPLAIELAAAWMPTLQPREISERLRDGFELLNRQYRGKPGRHQTLEATIQWSYALLPEDIQTLFQCLSVFMGGWTLDAAMEVCADEQWDEMDMLKMLNSLVNASLIIPSARDGHTRYNMLEMISHFGRTQLKNSGNEAKIRSSHLRFIMDFASSIQARLRGAEQSKQFDLFDAEYANIVAALKWCMSSLTNVSARSSEDQPADLDTIARLVSTLSRFFGVREHYGRVRRLYEAILAARESQPATQPWGMLYHEAGGFARMQGDYDAARHFYLEGLSIRDRFRDLQGIASSLSCVGLAYSDEGRYEEAEPYYQSALDINRALGAGSRFYSAICLNGLGRIAQRHGRYAEAASQLHEALVIMQDLKDGQGVAMAHYSLADLARSQGDVEQAHDHYVASLAIERRIGDQPRIAEILEGLAALYLVHENADTSVHLYALADVLRERTGMPVPLKDSKQVAKDKSAAGKDRIDAVRQQISSDGSLDSELNKYCDALKGASGTWEDTLSSLNITAGETQEHTASPHLLALLEQFIPLLSQTADANPLRKAQKNEPLTSESAQINLFLRLGESAFIEGLTSPAGAYYKVGLALALRFGDQSATAACQTGIEKAGEKPETVRS